jgi:catechol 2,3-dioxygenase-like lactoylglutathione lyase family enzyme
MSAGAPQVIPTLRIANYARSRSFYVDGLGFHVDWEHRFQPGFPVFAQISRDGMTLFLSEHRDDCPAGALTHFLVADVDAMYDELRSRGTVVSAPPSESLQGLRDMTVIDADGNKLRFITRLPHWQRDPPSETPWG